jgi:hypothetical protein
MAAIDVVSWLINIGIVYELLLLIELHESLFMQQSEHYCAEEVTYEINLG